MLTSDSKRNLFKLPAISLVWMSFASFATYCCMYGFRKGISAATFDGIAVMGISFKSALVITQVLGYMTSKFIGIKFISELEKTKRSRYILLLIAAAHFCLFLLAIVPKPYNVFFIFFNGLSLGLIWGLVFSFIEGRMVTDFVALILSTNFIFSSGIVKSLGRTLLEWGVPEIWMPFAVGVFFFPLLLIAVRMLNRIPPASAAETASRGIRVPLDGLQRKLLLKSFFIGLVAITILNLMLTILRDIKDNYGVEILRIVQPGFNPSIFTKMDTVAACSVLLLLLLIAGFKHHFKSIVVHHIVIVAGLTIVLSSAWLLQQGVLNPVFNLVFYTIGLYICYNTLQCLFLDRFMAAFKVQGNIGFFFYVMDAVGYLGSCFVIFSKEIFSPRVNWLYYFLRVSFWLGSIGIIFTIVSLVYFIRKYHRNHNTSIHISSNIHAATAL